MTSDVIERPAIAALPHQPVFIDGRWRDLSDRPMIFSKNPATEQDWYTIPDCRDSDVDEAVKAAHRAFTEGPWRLFRPVERGRLLRGIAEAVSANAKRLAVSESIDCGKVISETTGFVQVCADFLRFFGELADKVTGETFTAPRPGMHAYTIRVPVGVVAAIVPWNNPLWLLSLKLGPALAAGNTLVIKPSEVCSALVIEFLRIATEAVDIPKGVVNLVTGTGEPCGRALVSHPLVSRVAFTGGPETARHIVRQTAENLAEVSLELGGKSPALVFDDANLDNAVQSIVSGVFLGSAGQSCVASSRALVQEGVHDAFLERMETAARALRIGDPLDPKSQLGPLATAAQYQRVSAAVDAAIFAGARLVCGGKRPPHLDKGWYYEPTVIACGNHSDSIVQTELFGPVLTVTSFRDEEEALRLANDTRFGLAAGLFTRDLGRVHRLTGSIRAGIQYVNCYRMGAPMAPIGGFGDSGKSREGGIDAVREYTKPVTVWINTQI